MVHDIKRDEKVKDKDWREKQIHLVSLFRGTVDHLSLFV